MVKATDYTTTKKNTQKGSNKNFKKGKKTQTKKQKHPPGWCKKFHYMSLDGQCGQSCPCCRAAVYLRGIDNDAKWGACQICLHQ